MTTRPAVRRTIAGARGAWGVVALVAPPVNLALLGTPGSRNADGAYASRLFGARELALAAFSAGGPGARDGSRIGVAVDAVDLVSLIVAHRDGRVGRARVAVIGLAGVAAVAAGIYASGADADPSARG